MAELILMEKNGEQMNVPDGKLQAFLGEGWKVISKKSMNVTPLSVSVEDMLPPVESMLETKFVSVETPAAPVPEEKAEKPKGKGK